MSVDFGSQDAYAQRSLWLSEIPDLAPRPALEGNVQADVAVVGAGFTGLWTAYYLKRTSPDLRIVVVEREIAGFGASGRNGGWVSPGMAGRASAYTRNPERAGIVRATRESYDAVDEVGAVVAREGIACGYRKGGALTVATTAPQCERLEGDVRSAREMGLGEEDLRLIDGAEARELVDIEKCMLGTFTPQCARVQPARLARGLADVCEQLGVAIYEQTPALELAPGRVRCAAGSVSAEIVLRATEAYTIELPGEHRSFLPLYSLMVATEPLPQEVWRQLTWQDGVTVKDKHHLFFYAQRTSDDRIALGGRGAPYSLAQPINEQNERSSTVRTRLVQALRTFFPAAAEAKVTHHWGGPIAVPRDWSMGINFNRSSQVGWAGGYSGHGVVAANIAGRTLADLALHRESDLVTLPWVGHRARKWEPEPLRFLASQSIVRMLQSADAHEDATGHSARRTRLISRVLPPT